MTHSRTIEICGYSWGDAYTIMDDAIWNGLQKYAWPTPEPSKSMTMAETMLTLMTYSRTIEIYGYSRGDAYIIMHYVI